MPIAPLRMCSRPGCRNVQPCATHARAARREQDQRRGSSAARGYDGTWQRLRMIVLHEEPLCRYCRERGKLEPATTVDHMTPLSRGGARLDRANLAGACATCNAAKGGRTAEEFLGAIEN